MAGGRGLHCGCRGEVAQLVEHTAENRGVAGSSPALATLVPGGKSRSGPSEAPIPMTHRARVPPGDRAGAARPRRAGLRGRAHGALPRADRPARSRAELVRHRLRATRRSRTRERPTLPRSDAPFRGVPIAVKDLTATAGIRTTYSSRAFADNVPDFDTAVVRRLREAGFVHPRQDEHAGVRDGGVHRVGAERRHPEPVEPRAHARRVERRSRGGSRGRARAARARHRRRRLDQDSRLLLRRLRPQAVARPRLDSAVPVARGPLDLRARSPARSQTPPRCSTSCPATSRAIPGGRLRPSVRSRTSPALRPAVCESR